MSALLESLANGFAHLERRAAGGLEDLRRAALERALSVGLPGARAERWKYTSLRALERRNFTPAALPGTIASGALELPPAPRLVFANGHHVAALSDLSGLTDGVVLEPLSQALERSQPSELGFLARRFDADDEVFARLNAALAVEGMLLRVAPGVRCEAPLHVVFLGVADGVDRSWALRNLVELGDGARVALVEQHRSVNAHAHLGNVLTQVQLGIGAALEHARVQQEASTATSILRTDAGLAEAASYRRLDLELGAALARHELNVALHGKGAKLHANGVLFADGKRHLDTRLSIDHIACDTSCELEWRGLATGQAHAVFHGGILIRAGADGTDARLSNKNLLLSEQAAIDTQPVLEIHADEVQAAHGATVGNLDPLALFYLRSRGIPQAQAHALLTAAFCREVVGVFSDDRLRQDSAAALDRYLDTLA